MPSVDYLVRPFEGFVMAISGLPTERREEMRHLAIKHGGKISEDMTTNADYTHLIVDVSLLMHTCDIILINFVSELFSLTNLFSLQILTLDIRANIGSCALIVQIVK